MAKHQCDYCCWYWGGRCDCPLVMKSSSCESALRKKHEAERISGTRNFNPSKGY